MERHKVADVSDFRANGSHVISLVDGTEIAVFRYDGGYHAVANYCVHQGGPLCEGNLSGRMEGAEDGWGWNYDSDEKYIVCPWHGWSFDITDGSCLRTDKYRAPTFDVEVENDEIYVLL